MFKRYFLFCTLSILLFSCSSGDDISELKQDPFVGTWKLEMMFFDDVEQDLSECDRKANTQVNSDGTLFAQIYIESNGNCIADSGVGGTWEKRGNDYWTAILSELTKRNFTIDGDMLYDEFTDNN